MERPDDIRRDLVGRREQTPDGVTYDRRWAADLRSALLSSAMLLGLLLLIDRGAGSLTAPRAALWAGLAVLLLLVLYPARVTFGAG
ncbi:hypothetical protein [Streptomyces sp. NPDC050145]|uniref:hypothetical protein n=1 Tax=Streptomyces sp. NPDC050145 TaxID=3365602 RepID=UPI0037A0695A